MDEQTFLLLHVGGSLVQTFSECYVRGASVVYLQLCVDANDIKY